MRTFVKKVFIFSHKIKSFLKKITAYFKKHKDLFLTPCCFDKSSCLEIVN